MASVRGIFLPPQIAARLALKFTGAKRPLSKKVLVAPAHLRGTQGFHVFCRNFMDKDNIFL